MLHSIIYVFEQVLSKTVCDAFAYFGDPETEQLQKFEANFDRFFYCMNARNMDELSRKRKPNLKPYYSPDDERLKVSMS